MGRNKKNKPKVYLDKEYAKNFGYKILETKSLEDGIAFIRTLSKTIRPSRKHNLVDLADVNPTCVCCKSKGVKFCLGQGEFAGIKGRGDDLHWDLYTEDDVALSIDHIVPKSDGGANHISNYQLMCVVCNSFKGRNPERLIPYMELMNQGFKVKPMIISNFPFLAIGSFEQLPNEVYNALKDYIAESKENNQFKYFLIDQSIDEI